jgi:hypothetical protein
MAQMFKTLITPLRKRPMAAAKGDLLTRNSLSRRPEF